MMTERETLSRWGRMVRQPVRWPVDPRAPKSSAADPAWIRRLVYLESQDPSWPADPHQPMVLRVNQYFIPQPKKEIIP